MSTTEHMNKPEVSVPLQGKEWYLDRFASFEKRLNGDSKTPLHNLRKNAIVRFGELGFPTTRNEDWKYTDVTPLTKIQFDPFANGGVHDATLDQVKKFTFGDEASYLLVCVNGQYVASLSRIPASSSGVKIGGLKDLMSDDWTQLEASLGRCAEFADNSFTALNTAFLRDGVVVVVPEKIKLDLPVHILHIATTGAAPFITNSRILIVAGKRSEATFVESYVSLGEDVYFTNAVTEVLVSEDAILEHDRLQTESSQAFHVGNTYVQQGRSSTFTSNSIALGGRLVRNNVFVVLDGEGAEATLNGLYLGTGAQHIDNHTTIDHAKPHCPSHELYKGILAGTSRGVFNGKIRVRKDAQKTDAKQTNKNLILSEGASVDTKPQLEILANDVKCTHGATIGQIDDEALFYLRTRGVGAEAARDMLTFAFASDVIDRVHVEPLRGRLEAMIHDKLQQERLD